MILQFKFELETTNGVIEKILLRVAKKLNIKIGLSRDIKYLYAYIDADEKEIEEFSNILAKELPLSIYLKSLDAKICEEFIDDLDRDFPKINLPPCPKCLREVKDKENKNYFNPFLHCEVCGYQNVKGFSANFEEIFENLAKKLKNESIFIQTMNGKYEITTNLENVEKIVAVDLASVVNFFMSFEGDDKALASIEKPFINLKTNLNFKKEFGLSTPSYLVKLPDCMVLELLCEKIKDEIKLIGLIPSIKSDDFSFDIINNDEELVAVVCNSDNKDILIQKGDRSLLPKYEKYIGDIIAYNGYYETISKDNKTILQKTTEYKECRSKLAFAGFLGVIKQWELEDKNSFGIALYEKEESKIMLNSPKFGLVEYIDFEFKYNSFEEIFANISAMNDTGKRLIENYSKKKEFKKALNSNLDTSLRGIAYLWGLIGVVLGFDNNIDKAYEKLLNFSNSAMTKKGPRIDYKLDNKNLNPLWAIRTAMSFKLAGVDNYLLSYGVVESFAEFLSNRYEEVNKEVSLDGAVIVGDMFKGEFLNKIYSYIRKNFYVYTPKALSMSGAIESFGSAIIISKNLQTN